MQKSQAFSQHRIKYYAECRGWTMLTAWNTHTVYKRLHMSNTSKKMLLQTLILPQHLHVFYCKTHYRKMSGAYVNHFHFCMREAEITSIAGNTMRLAPIVLTHNYTARCLQNHLFLFISDTCGRYQVKRDKCCNWPWVRQSSPTSKPTRLAHRPLDGVSTTRPTKCSTSACTPRPSPALPEGSRSTPWRRPHARQAMIRLQRPLSVCLGD